MILELDIKTLFHDLYSDFFVDKKIEYFNNGIDVCVEEGVGFDELINLYFENYDLSDDLYRNIIYLKELYDDRNAIYFKVKFDNIIRKCKLFKYPFDKHNNYDEISHYLFKYLIDNFHLIDKIVTLDNGIDIDVHKLFFNMFNDDKYNLNVKRTSSKIDISLNLLKKELDVYKEKKNIESKEKVSIIVKDITNKLYEYKRNVDIANIQQRQLINRYDYYLKLYISKNNKLITKHKDDIIKDLIAYDALDYHYRSYEVTHVYDTFEYLLIDD